MNPLIKDINQLLLISNQNNFNEKNNKQIIGRIFKRLNKASEKDFSSAVTEIKIEKKINVRDILRNLGMQIHENFVKKHPEKPLKDNLLIRHLIPSLPSDINQKVAGYLSIDAFARIQLLSKAHKKDIDTFSIDVSDTFASNLYKRFSAIGIPKNMQEIMKKNENRVKTIDLLCDDCSQRQEVSIPVFEPKHFTLGVI